MTRSMNARLECPTCRCQMSMESHFERWMRDHRLLRSEEGIVRFDLDVLLHRYMVKEDGIGKRDIQAMMFIEVKSFASDVTESQRDTIHLLNQVLRNRKPNINGDRNKWNAKDHVPLCKAFSTVKGREVALKLLGGHLLVFEGAGPDDSAWIEWDRKRISKQQLVKLLRFELDPDDPRILLDIRRRSKPLPLIDRDTEGDYERQGT